MHRDTTLKTISAVTGAKEAKEINDMRYISTIPS